MNYNQNRNKISSNTTMPVVARVRYVPYNRQILLLLCGLIVSISLFTVFITFSDTNFIRLSKYKNAAYYQCAGGAAMSPYNISHITAGNMTAIMEFNTSILVYGENKTIIAKFPNYISDIFGDDSCSACNNIAHCNCKYTVDQLVAIYDKLYSEVPTFTCLLYEQNDGTYIFLGLTGLIKLRIGYVLYLFAILLVCVCMTLIITIMRAAYEREKLLVYARIDYERI